MSFFKGLTEVWIAYSTRLDKINRAVEQVFEILCQPEILICMLCGLHLFKFNEQIKIASLGIEPVISRRTEYCETADPAVSAYPDNFV